MDEITIRWVPVSKRTPEINPELREYWKGQNGYSDYSDPVLCFLSNGRYAVLRYCVEPFPTDIWTGWVDEEWNTYYPTHWHPLPPPPEVP